MVEVSTLVRVLGWYMVSLKCAKIVLKTLKIYSEDIKYRSIVITLLLPKIIYITNIKLVNEMSNQINVIKWFYIDKPVLKRFSFH